MANIIDGRAISQAVLNDLKAEVLALKEKHGQVPGLVTFLVGNNPASLSYVSLKIKKAKEIGFLEKQVNLPEGISEAELIKLIEEHNNNPLFHGILVQLPLPRQINLENIIAKISPAKDVDGFHPYNVGEMFSNYQNDGLYPCTPKGIIYLLKTLPVNYQGKNVVVLGRSNLVGKPVATMALEKKLLNATVTVLHSKSENYQEYTRVADVVIACMGKAHFIQKEDVKEGAVIIDVGVNKIGENPQSKKAILVGDVDFAGTKEKASHITPVPGGVGPMTIAMLMENTLHAFKKSLKK